jgi:hypothetical protein
MPSPSLDPESDDVGGNGADDTGSATDDAADSDAADTDGDASNGGGPSNDPGTNDSSDTSEPGTSNPGTEGDASDDDEGSPVPAVEPLPELATGACLSSGWCWSARSYFGDQINAGTRGLEDGSVFAVSRAGHVLQWVDERYVYHEGVSESELESIVVLNEHDVWVGGYLGGWHYDGAQWEQVATERVDNLEYALGKLWGTRDGKLFVWENDAWADAGLESGAELPVTDLLSSEDGETLWAVVLPESPAESSATVYRYQGAAWESLGESPSGFFIPQLVTINGQLHLSGSDVWNLDDDWSSWGVGQVYRLFAAGGGQVYYSTSDGRFFRWDGTQGQLVSWTSANAVWPAADDRVWLSPHTGGALLFDPQTDTLEVPPASSELYAFDSVPAAVWADAYVAWGASETDVWRATTSREAGEFTRPLQHFDGSSWTTMLPNLEINDIHGCSADNVWIVPQATNTLYRWNGEALLDQPFPTDFISLGHAVRCVAENDVWLAGETWDATIEVIHFDGESWTSMYTHPYSRGRPELRSYLVSPEPGKFWLSSNADIHYFDGSTWSHEFSTGRDATTPLVATADALWLFSNGNQERWQQGTLQSLDSPPMNPRGAQLLGANVWIWGTEHALVKRFLP